MRNIGVETATGTRSEAEGKVFCDTAQNASIRNVYEAVEATLKAHFGAG